MPRISVIGAFYGNAGVIRGAEIGAMKIKDRLARSFFECNVDNIFFDNESPNFGESCISEVIDFCRILQNRVEETLGKNINTLVIGGDHSISLGSITGAANYATNHNKKFGVIYIDAHGDINTLESSNTKNIHGMTLASSMGIGDDRLLSLTINPLNPENVVFVGVRSLDRFEKQLIEDLGIKCITSQEINEAEFNCNPVRNLIFNQICDFIKNRGLDQIHLSIDVDVLDPSIAPGTGVPESEGISSEKLSSLVSLILGTGLVKSVDFVEFNPMLDVRDKTFEISFKLCESIIRNL